MQISGGVQLSCGVNLVPGGSGGAGGGGVSFGYASGGYTTTAVNTIQKFPFASDGNASDVGDLTEARFSLAGQQG